MYYHHDHLSNRLLTDSSGNVLGQHGHFPFGETWYESGTTTKLKFTTYERDSESSNDYALASVYINRFGRFPSTDPVRGSTGNPQSLNSYACVLNNTLNLVAPGIAGATLAPSLNRAAYISLGSAAAPGLGSTAASASPTSRERLHVELGSDGGGNDPYKRGIPAGTISALFKIQGAAPAYTFTIFGTGINITVPYFDDPQVHAFMIQYSLPGMINEVSLGEALYLYEHQLKGSLADFGNDALGGPVWGPLGSWFSPGDVSNFKGPFRDGLPIHIPDPFVGGGGGGGGGTPSWCNAFCRL
jgi:RHS repeat-associated protein